MLNEAFRTICRNIKVPHGYYVSLYCKHLYYGGPEEGGWWGHDMVLECYEEFATETEANEAFKQIQELAGKATVQSSREHDEMCLRQCEFLENRGLDYDYLPENDGPEEYKVYIENTVGEHEYRGPRHYE
jgi:hypothetical protein